MRINYSWHDNLPGSVEDGFSVGRGTLSVPDSYDPAVPDVEKSVRDGGFPIARDDRAADNNQWNLHTDINQVFVSTDHACAPDTPGGGVKIMVSAAASFSGPP